MQRRIFPEGNDDTGRISRPYNDLRWSVFTNRAPQEMFEIVDEHVFPFLRRLGGEGSSYARNMKDARFTIPTPALLAKVVDLLRDIPMDDRDTKGDIYEYMLAKLSQSGQNGQFRTSRHIIKLMVDMTAPRPDDRIIDPAAGTAGFLVMASEYLRKHHPEVETDASVREFFNTKAFTGFDSDAAMARIASMNMLLHGVEEPVIERGDSLAEGHPASADYTLVLANPPFAGSLDYETVAKDLQQVVKTKKTELLFLALMIKLLKNGGRAAVIVPDGVLFGSSNAHKALRKMLVEDHKLDAVVKLPSGTFKPYTGVSTAILFFTKTSSGGTDHVWFYDVRADGFTLDDKRTPIEANDLPDVLARWIGSRTRGRSPAHRPVVPRAEGRDRRQRVRPLDQPIQGDRARGGRAPLARGDPRRTRRSRSEIADGLQARCGRCSLSLSRRSQRAPHDAGSTVPVRATRSTMSHREAARINQASSDGSTGSSDDHRPRRRGCRRVRLTMNLVCHEGPNSTDSASAIVPADSTALHQAFIRRCADGVEVARTAPAWVRSTIPLPILCRAWTSRPLGTRRHFKFLKELRASPSHPSPNNAASPPSSTRPTPSARAATSRSHCSTTCAPRHSTRCSMLLRAIRLTGSSTSSSRHNMGPRRRRDRAGPSRSCAWGISRREEHRPERHEAH